MDTSSTCRLSAFKVKKGMMMVISFSLKFSIQDSQVIMGEVMANIDSGVNTQITHLLPILCNFLIFYLISDGALVGHHLQILITKIPLIKLN